MIGSSYLKGVASLWIFNKKSYTGFFGGFFTANCVGFFQNCFVNVCVHVCAHSDYNPSPGSKPFSLCSTSRKATASPHQLIASELVH